MSSGECKRAAKDGTSRLRKRANNRPIAADLVYKFDKSSDRGKMCPGQREVDGERVLLKSHIGNEHDIRNEMRSARKRTAEHSRQEDEDFMTPPEQFKDSGRRNKEVQNDGGHISVIEGSDCLTQCKNIGKGDAIEKMRKKSRTDKGIHKNTTEGVGQCKKIDDVVDVVEGKSKGVARGKKGGNSRGTVKAKKNSKKKEVIRSTVKGKKERTYEGYIQKKFSPAIMTDVLLNLSDEQKEWVKSTGFGVLLEFRMVSYTHRLGYNVVDAFDSEECLLDLRAGKVNITEITVHNVLGLPIGDEEIVFQKEIPTDQRWSKQFAGTLITPFMVRDRIFASRRANNKFKWNFLVLIYNFFFEANQNRYVTKDILKFSGDIDHCSIYNWCGLLIRKLKITHEFWADKKDRIFAGPLPFLINNGTVYAPLTLPTFRGWTDMLLRQRQMYDVKNDTFGLGSLVDLSGIDEVGVKGMTNVSEMSTNESEDGVELVENTTGGRGKPMSDDEFTNNDIGSAEHCARNSEGSPDRECEGVGVEGHVQAINLRTPHIGDRTIHSTDGNVQSTNCDVIVDDMLGARDKTATDMSIGVVMGESTQKRADDEIDQYFEEHTYMEGFEKNLMDLDLIYKKCLTNFIGSLALYPENTKLEELKKRYPHFFRMFADSSPISKSLSSKQQNKKLNKSVDQDDDERYVPNYSLGLTQVFPTNLGESMDVCAAEEPCKTPKMQLKKNNDKGKQPTQVTFESAIVHQNVRPKRGRVPTAICRSPYVSRVIDVNTHVLTSEERNIWEWLFENKRNKGDTLFEFRGRGCTKAHLRSLDVNKSIETTVIDSWTCMLNENELLRSDASPLRLFLTSETTYGPMHMEVDKNDRMAKLSRSATFDDNMEVVLRLVNEIHNKRFDIPDFDMFLFPVYSGSHHYIICYNIRIPRWEILDNIVQTMSLQETYGDLPWALHECFCHFLECYKLPNHAQIVSLEPQVLSMEWQTMNNYVDCGVFVMWHLETYMGNVYKWKTGLRTEQDNQKMVLNKLRVIYCHKLLTWIENKRRKENLDGMTAFVKKR